jgi:hypothetical protein
VNEHDLHAFEAKPVDLLGRWFSLAPNLEEDRSIELYQIVNVIFTLQGTEYKVLFEGCAQCDNFDAKELKELLKASMLFAI